MMLAAVGVGGELLAAVFQPAHRIAALHRKPAQADFLTRQDRLVSKAAADVGRDDANLDLGKREDLRQPGADHVRELGGAVQDELAEPCIPLRDEAATFDRRHDLPRGPQLACDLDRRRLRGCLDRAVETCFKKDVALDGLMHEHALRRLRRQHVDDGRQLLVFDGDFGGNVLRLRTRVGDAHGDQLADVADLVGDQGRLLRDLKAGQRRDRPDRAHAGQIGGREYRRSQAVGDANAGQARMRHRATDESRLAHSRQQNVADILPAAVQETVVFLPPKPGAHSGLGQSQVSKRVRGRASPFDAVAC